MLRSFYFHNEILLQEQIEKSEHFYKISKQSSAIHLLSKQLHILYSKILLQHNIKEKLAFRGAYRGHTHRFRRFIIEKADPPPPLNCYSYPAKKRRGHICLSLFPQFQPKKEGIDFLITCSSNTDKNISIFFSFFLTCCLCSFNN